MILYKCFLCVCFVIILVYCDTVWGRREKREKESCRQPDTVQNAVLTSKYVNEKSFKDGDIVMYLCDIGYTIEGRSRERTCNDGKWSAVRFTCSLIRCPYVPTPEHGRRIDANNAAGDYTEFTCDIGYKIKGRSKLLCRTDGNWLPSTPPICDPILCPNLQNIRNGRLFQDTSDGLRNNYQSVTEYSCDIGYYINAKTDTKVYRRECQADGTWSNREPTCDVPKCEDINDFWGGQVVFFGDKKLYSQVYYICNDSYTIFPKDVAYSECERTLQWKPRQPECLKKATKEVPKNGYSPERKTELLHNETYRVYCRRDYEFYSDGYLEGIHQMTITNNNGTLEPKVPECREERCDPTQQRNAFVQYKIGSDFTTKITSRTEVFLSCHKGYKYYNNGIEMESPLTRTCVKGKVERAPICEEERCDPSEQNHAIVNYKNRANVTTKIISRTEVLLSCQKGYKYYDGDEVMTTPLRRTCVKGQIEKAPTCEEERCDPIEQRHAIVKYTNGLDVTTKIISGTAVLLSCQEGYMFEKGVKEINSPTLKTCIKGIIEGAPKCEEKKCEFSGYPFNQNTQYQLFNPRNSAKDMVVDGSSIEPGNKITVLCNREEELYVNSSDVYLKTFTSECRRGSFDPKKVDFPVCLEKRCSFDVVSTKHCFFTDQNNECKQGEFRVQSGSSIHLKCPDGYKLTKSDGENTVEDMEKVTIDCNKGKYEKGVRCIPDSKWDEIKDIAIRSSENIAKMWSRLTCRFFIFKTSGCEDSCVIPNIPFGFAKSLSNEKIEFDANHRTTISIACNSGYTLSKEMTTTCSFGQWDNNKFPVCTPNPCYRNLHDGTLFRVNSQLLTKHDGKKQPFENGTELQIECQNGYKMKDMKTKAEVKNKKRSSFCLLGQWTDEYECIPESCKAQNVKNAKMNAENVDVFKHKEQVTYICANGFHFNNTSQIVNELETVCSFGNWTKPIPLECKPDPCRLTLSEGTLFRVNSQLLTKDDGIRQTFKHGTKLVMECDLGYKLKNTKRKRDVKGTKRNTTCVRGQWKREFKCILDMCRLHLRNGSTYYLENNDTVTEITVAGLVNHTAKIQLYCLEKFDVFSVNESRIIRNKDYVPIVTCNHGIWKNVHQCKKKCYLFNITDGIFNKDGVNLTSNETFSHGENVTLQCNNEYDYKMVMKCDDGEWQNKRHCSDSRHPSTTISSTEAISIGCVLFNITEGIFRKDGVNLTSGDTISHGENVTLQCNNEYDNKMVMKCDDGEWQNKMRCSDTRHHSTTITSTMAISIETTVEKHDNLDSNENESDSSNNGDMYSSESENVDEQREQINGCNLSKDPRFSYTDSRSKVIDPGTMIYDGTTLTVTCADVFASLGDYNDDDPTVTCTGNVLSQFDLECPERCKLSEDPRFSYTDTSGKEIDPGATINDGTTLTVTCATIDYNDFFGDYYSDYDTNVSQDPTVTVTCTENKLSQFDLNCPEVALETCKELKNGTVKMDFIGFYYVSCDKGFSLNIYTDNPKCTCINGKLWYGKLEPVCTPVPCEVPKDGFDERLTLKNDKKISLSGGSTVKHGDYVYFDCTKAFQQIYEPSNRRFKCVRGNWTEADTDDVDWKLGNGGDFPTCRKAICEPNCTHGGICYEDNKCRCPELTEGDRCESYICDPECLNNGGNCTGPGECKCQVGRSGPNCELEGCVLPENAAKYKDSRKIFSAGETLTSFTCDRGSVLSSKEGMTCMENGVWSDIVFCQKAIFYLISVKTGSKTRSGTDANVYVTLHGLNGVTERIRLYGSFESGNLDENRIQARDIRPIESIVIGHDGSGIAPGWFVNYTSIYVEDMEEYYVFPYNNWVYGAIVPRQGDCVSSFDKRIFGDPKWSLINKDNKYIALEGRVRTSLRGCKQACVIYGVKCVAIQYIGGRCFGFASIQANYFTTKKDSLIFVRKCK